MTKRQLARDAARMRDRRAKDPEGVREYQRKWRAENPELVKRYSRRVKLKLYYGLTEAAYDMMLRGQDGKCAICGTTDSGKRHFGVDHCHATGKVRGLLCLNCNAGIGRLNDDPETVAKALSYLQRSAA